MALSKWLSLAQLLAPIILTFVKPSLAPIATKVSDGIAEAEQIPGATGPQKLQHVQNIAQDAAETTNAAAGKEVIDITNLNQAVSEGVSTAVSVINLVHDSSVKPTVPTPVTPVQK